jgi:uncharacterized membrane protein YeaQ/YmgE (transglycosylase-associated protein family)
MGAAMGLKHMSFMWTVLLGVGGSILGGLIARLFSKPQPGAPFHPAGFIMSIIGAFVLVFIVAKLHLLG